MGMVIPQKLKYIESNAIKLPAPDISTMSI
jgi:hypothetical protein